MMDAVAAAVGRSNNKFLHLNKKTVQDSDSLFRNHL